MLFLWRWVLLPSWEERRWRSSCLERQRLLIRRRLLSLLEEEILWRRNCLRTEQRPIRQRAHFPSKDRRWRSSCLGSRRRRKRRIGRGLLSLLREGRRSRGRLLRKSRRMLLSLFCGWGLIERNWRVIWVYGFLG